MGKYPNSAIHRNFSDWHYKECKDKAYLTDIDRLWIETRERKPKVLFDLKYKDDIITKTEKITYNWFINQNIPVFILEFRSKKWSDWRNGINIQITNFETSKTRRITDKELKNWIDNDFEDDIFIPSIEVDS